MVKKDWTRQLVLAGVFTALGVLVPLIFHMVGDAGQVFLPMHFPVLVAGAFLVPGLALLTGILSPLLSSLLIGMPVFPFVYILALEMGAYGVLVSFLWHRRREHKGHEPRGYRQVWTVLVPVMLLGRGVRIGASYVLLPLLMGIPFSPGLVASAVFIRGLPGILLQLLLVPLILERTSSFRER